MNVIKKMNLENIFEGRKGQLMIFGTILMLIILFTLVLLLSIGIGGGITLEIITDYEEPELNILLTNIFFRTENTRELLFNYSVAEHHTEIEKHEIEDDLTHILENYIATEPGFEREVSFEYMDLDIDNDINVEPDDRWMIIPVKRPIFAPFGNMDNVSFVIEESDDFEMDLPGIANGFG